MPAAVDDVPDDAQAEEGRDDVAQDPESGVAEPVRGGAFGSYQWRADHNVTFTVPRARFAPYRG